MRKTIYFSGRLLRGNRATKTNADGFNAFESFNYPHLAEAGININYREEYILKPRDKDGYIFDHYEIEGTYENISKDGNTWTIVAHSSLTIHVMYKGVTPKPNPHDNKPVSPSTGVNMVLYSVMIVLGLCGIAFATRKLVKAH